ncbi:MAG: formimidoylglutamate deiminase [Candidatus Schekmanbacteria bacterium]|nr:formimidoylglutamate deiminase [Candidatus Schekmanbacteria bacterium]
MNGAAHITLVPDLMWHRGEFRTGLAVTLAGDRIAAVGPRDDAAGPRTLLPGKALLPGLVNAHSHSFQRLLRGHAQVQRGELKRSDFFSWRETMYRLAASLTPDDLLVVARHAFTEMLSSGITAVGEFHYLHHCPDGQRYADPHETSWSLIQAAKDVGIRLCLLRASYLRAGAGKPLQPLQRRFSDGSVEACVTLTTDLAARVAAASDGRVTAGIAPHSLRALPAEAVVQLAVAAQRLDAPLHMHVAEQPAEIEEVRSEHGNTPLAVLASCGVLTPRFVAVHATHVTAAELDAMASAGAGICLCPATEADLGDGAFATPEALCRGLSLSLGTDDHITMDLLRQAGDLEMRERLRQQHRLVLPRAPHALLDAATAGGASALRLPCGRIEPGRLADLVAVDLEHPALAGWEPSANALTACLLYSSGSATVSDVWVAGEHLVQSRGHATADAHRFAFANLARRIWS